MAEGWVDWWLRFKAHHRHFPSILQQQTGRVDHTDHASLAHQWPLLWILAACRKGLIHPDLTSPDAK
jgi:hypothetical protein